MPRISMLPTIMRERFGARTLPREPEPDLVMDDPDQVESYAQAGRIDGVMSAAYLFHTAHITATLSGRKRVLDLGCGPATQLAQVAELNPEIEFVGVDLSPTMLDMARSHIASKGLNNVTFQQSDITAMSSLANARFDGIISTMALHHLPTLNHLAACFREIKRLLIPGGALYLVDFGRLKSLKSVIFFAYYNADNQPHLFSLDYERSLRAAFLKEDFGRLAKEELPQGASVHATAFLPILTLIKTAPGDVPPAKRQRLREMRSALPAKYRSELDDIRMLFRLGGLTSDPFK